MAHARRRLVEQQHLRIERQCCGNLQRALAAVRQLDRRPIGEDDSPTSAISASARSLKLSSTAVERQKSNEPPRWRCKAMRTFSSTVMCGNTAEIWNERTRPEPRHIGRRHRGDVLTLVQNAPARGAGIW